MAPEDLSRSSHGRGGEVLWENAIGPGRAAAGRKFPHQGQPSVRGLSCGDCRGLHKQPGVPRESLLRSLFFPLNFPDEGSNSRSNGTDLAGDQLY